MENGDSSADGSERLRDFMRSADDQNRARFGAMGGPRSSTSEASASLRPNRAASELASLLDSLGREGDRDTTTRQSISFAASASQSSVRSASNIASSIPVPTKTSTAFGGGSVSGRNPVKPSVSQQPLPSTTNRTSGSYNFDFQSNSIEDLQDELSSASLASSSATATQSGTTDTLDHSVIRFNQNYAIRGRLGLYLTTVVDTASSENTNTTNFLQSSVRVSGGLNATTKTYLLGVEGQGVGEDVDCLNFVSVDSKESDGGIKYGQVIAIKSPYSKERLLGLREGQRIGFWRHVVGQGEKWTLLKAQVGSSASSSSVVGGGGLAGHYLGSEDASARGQYVRVGDSVLLQTYKSDHLLALQEGAGSVKSEPRLVYRERTGLGSELWQIEMFGAVPLPAWMQQRPYLSGKYLVTPPTLRSPAPEVEARTFARSTQTPSQTLPHAHTHPLHNFSLSEQHHIFVRELLLLLSGVEGHYLRVAANPTPSTVDPNNLTTGGSSRANSNPTALLLPRLKEIRLAVDVESADKSSATQVSLLLTLCESVLHVRDFVRQHSRYEYGIVSHALCGAIKTILHDLDVLVCQLEFLLNTQRLTLQKMMFLLQPVKRTLTLLERVTERVRELTGGALLNVLYVCVWEQGDEKARELCEHLLKSAAEPFLKTLSLWIFRGELHDPYKEFMVAEDVSLSKEALQEDFNAQYWENRFSLSTAHTPQWLSSHAHKALTAGKYLAVVRDCMGDTALRERDGETDHAETHLSLPTQQSLSLSRAADSAETPTLTDRIQALCQAIERAHSYASQSLLSLLLSSQCALHTHLLSLGRFFLLQHGDFFTHLMDATEGELRKEVKEVSVSRLSHSLSLAVQSSSLASDPHRESLHCTLAPHNLMQHLHLIQIAGESSMYSHSAGGKDVTGNTYAEIHSSLTSQGLKGVEAFTLEYAVQWPVSLVLSKRILTKYQLLSRLLYFSKHVERRLLAAWQTHQETKSVRVHPMRSSYILRQRMVHFMQNFVYYITLEVIHPRSHALQKEMESVSDMDQVLELHEKFLDSCLKECLLASQDLLKILTKIMTTCLLFADHTARFLFESLAQAAAESESATKSAQAQLVLVKKESPQKKVIEDKRERELERERERVRERLLRDVERRRQRDSDVRARLVDETSHESFTRILNKFTKAFDDQLKEFLDNLWTTSHKHHAQLANLCVRLDYNGYYSAQFAPPIN